jgi:hypothetical protein
LQSKGAGYSPKNDFRAALVDWTEKGNAPEVITGTHYETSDDGESVATFKRPLCKVGDVFSVSIFCERQKKLMESYSLSSAVSWPVQV